MAFEHRYSSTMRAPQAFSSGVGAVLPCAIVGDKHAGHAGLFTQVKKDRLNHLLKPSDN